MSKVIVHTPIPQYKVLYDLPQGTDLVIVIGSRGSAKPHEVRK